MAHLPERHRAAYLAGLSPGADLDHRGTPFTPELLGRLLDALRDPATGRPHLGTAEFTRAAFSGTANFSEATFSGAAYFNRATFSGAAYFMATTFSDEAWFSQVTFSDVVGFAEATFADVAGFNWATFSDLAGFSEATFSSAAELNGASFSDVAAFDGATFSDTAGFNRAAFADEAWFDRVSFSGVVGFDGATFAGAAKFAEATFSGTTDFGGATFSGNVTFNDAHFERAAHLGPLVCGMQLVLDRAVFQQPVTVEIAARQVSCARTRWASTATLQLRYAELDLRDAIFEYPVLVAARPDPYPRHHGPLPEAALSGQDPGVRLMSVGGVDVIHLALHDIDLSSCRLAGAMHLDQLKVDGWCTFDTTPIGWDRHLPWRWSRRNALTEEHHWRVRTARHPDRAVTRGWARPPQDSPELKPAAVAALYRQMRKSLEDGKNEPDAADFYYGECEMRRHDTTRPSGERALLAVYWALSGYGLRAVRALAWLGAAMAATVAVMVLWGLPGDDPKPTTTGRQAAVGQRVLLLTSTPAPVNPTGPLTERVSTERGEKALRVVINSVIFRSSGQDLTTTGTYTEMLSRLAEPALLGLVVLAVRNRVKR
ncbi:pentapeptide repeat-containing protein [Streptomyces sp. NPDC006465]|uniref:pentapeptide repeat-containing protein n=1 Tax=Streptomyces sp. NPDC006465 TaxID=3157174 RepID=UPI0033B3366C